jgi:hypothetical protein
VLFLIAIAKSFLLPTLTLTLSPRWGRGDKRKEVSVNAIIILKSAMSIQDGAQELHQTGCGFRGYGGERDHRKIPRFLSLGDLPPVVVPSFKLGWGSSGDAPLFGPF